MDTLPQYALIAMTVELTEEMKQAIALVKYRVKEYNSIEKPTDADERILREYVDDFNFQQRRNAVKGSPVNSVDLLKMYAKRRFVARIKLGCHSSNNKLGVEFVTHELSFDDFCMAHKTVFPSFGRLKASLSSLCYLVRQNMTNEIDGKIRFKRLAWIITSPENPYNHNYFLLESDNREDYYSYGKVRDALIKILDKYFPGAPHPEFGHYSMQWFMVGIAESTSVDRLTRWLILMAAYAMYPKMGKDEESGSHLPSRHVAWCAYENKRRCTKLDIDCHSSVSCPFYMEAASKRK